MAKNKDKNIEIKKQSTSVVYIGETLKLNDILLEKNRIYTTIPTQLKNIKKEILNNLFIPIGDPKNINTSLIKYFTELLKKEVTNV